MKYEYAVIDDKGRVWVRHHVAFSYAPAGLNTFPKEKAEEIVNSRGGYLYRVVIEDENGPCCYHE